MLCKRCLRRKKIEEVIIVQESLQHFVKKEKKERVALTTGVNRCLIFKIILKVKGDMWCFHVLVLLVLAFSSSWDMCSIFIFCMTKLA